MKATLPCCALIVAAIFSHTGAIDAVAATESDFVPVTDAMLENPDPADWTSFRRTANSWGYSPLAQINRANVNRLTLVWARPMTEGVQEATPLVYDGVMYLPNPSDVTQAIDARTGVLLWEYRRPVPEDLSTYVDHSSINRNLAIYGRLIIDNGLDDYLYALDAETGKLAWETQQLDYRDAPSLQSSGPIIANGRAVSGRGCEPTKGPTACVITAHDALTGKELWRTSTIDPRNEPGDSWGGYPRGKRSHVGTWFPPSYDPESNLVIVGTSVTWPAPKFIFGDNGKKYLYHNSTLALDADTGEIVWHYQHVVDHWDMDHVFERILDEVTLKPDPAAVTWINPSVRAGERRKVVTGIPGKTGIVYTLDLATGEFLWATPTVMQNIVQDIDRRTGAVTVNPDMVYAAVGENSVVCPSSTGGKNWPAGAYDPQRKVMFYPLLNACMKSTAVTDDPDVLESYGILREHRLAPGKENAGAVYAISAETGKVIWKHEQRAGMTSLVATAGGLVFGGDAIGNFRAFDQETGEVLWTVRLGSQVSGFPITFAVDGRQYLAVSTGMAPLIGQQLTLTPELRSGNVNQMFVFAFPETGSAGEAASIAATPVRKPTPGRVNAPAGPSSEQPSQASTDAATAPAQAFTGTTWEGVYTAEQAQRGMKAYEQWCESCHAAGMHGGRAARGLVGLSFQLLWKDRSLADLFAAASEKMPPGNPEGLDAQVYADLVAAILQQNEFPAGDAELKPNAGALRPIRITWDSPET